MANPFDEKMQRVRKQEAEARAQYEAKKLNLSYADLSTMPIAVEALALVPEKKARQSKMAVIAKKDQVISIAVAQDPKKPEIQQIIQELQNKGLSYSLIFISLESLRVAIERYKDIPKEYKSEVSGKVVISGQTFADLREKIKKIDDVSGIISSFGQDESSKIVEVIIVGALNLDASDVHFEPKEEETIFRFRIDGVLHDVAKLAPATYKSVLTRFKLLSEMVLNVHDIAQDGRFTISLDKTNIEVRVSIIPGNYGESLVMRILNPKAIALKLGDMGFREDIYQLLEKEIKKPHGIIITTGPTGSGKTTTLYAFLKKIASPDIKIITLEDPVEYHLSDIVQTQVEAEREYTFASGLRAILRQDPDVILVGEIRDAETAEIAVQSAQTGHLVFSTLHTNDAAGAIPRFIMLKVQPSILSDALNLIMAQRLVRRLCQNCKKEVKPTAEEMKKIKDALGNLPKNVKVKPIDDNLTIFRSGSCEKCAGTGYKSRIGIIEILIVNGVMEKLIAASPTHADIVDLAKKQGMVTLYQDGMIKVAEGITSIEELESIVGSEEE